VPLWREAGPKDLSGNLTVRLSVATEGFNRRWYSPGTGQTITDIQRLVKHPALRGNGSAPGRQGRRDPPRLFGFSGQNRKAIRIAS
jgi:hypothetical protein